MSGLAIRQALQPEIDEVEVSIFGPGFGESIAIHSGHGKWIIVDSCRDLSGDGDNAVLCYLESLNVDLGSSVELIVVTHWHEDHIGGIADVIDECPGAKVAITAALNNENFQASMAPWIAGPDAHAKGAGELLKLGPRLKNLKFSLASVNKVLLERKVPCNIRIKALSPSDASIAAGIAELAGLNKNDWSGRLPSIHGNHTSVALSVEIADRRILLGSDLMVRASRDHGWLAAVDACLESQADKSSLFKIPHHGSENGDHEEIWTHLLHGDPFVLMAPFVRGAVKLPKQEDIDRILNKTGNAWITARPDGAKLRAFDRSIKREMEFKARRISEVPRGFGHVRARGRIGADPSLWDIELFGNAVDLASMRQR